jgi:hypothetical protein
VSLFEDASWICDQVFLTDICGHLNDLNSKLQGKYQLVNDRLYNSVSAFDANLIITSFMALSNNICHFPN